MNSSSAFEIALERTSLGLVSCFVPNIPTKLDVRSIAEEENRLRRLLELPADKEWLISYLISGISVSHYRARLGISDIDALANQRALNAIEQFKKAKKWSVNLLVDIHTKLCREEEQMQRERGIRQCLAWVGGSHPSNCEYMPPSATTCTQLTQAARHPCRAYP